MPKPRRRNIQLSPAVHEFLDAWQARDRAESGTGNAPISAFINRLIEESGEMWQWELGKTLPESEADKSVIKFHIQNMVNDIMQVQAKGDTNGNRIEG